MRMPDYRPKDANQLIEETLSTHCRKLEKCMDADVFSMLGEIRYGMDEIIRRGLDSRPKRRPNLAVVLETPGGFIEVVQRIADTFRAYYPDGRVDFIVPNFALSAGTVLVCSGDAIWMDSFAVLGPIDPQYEGPGGTLLPADGYLVQYRRLIKKSAAGKITPAEVAFLLDKFDPAMLYKFEQAKKLSVRLLREWLSKRKFKNWTVTETRKQPVDDGMRETRAEEIAKELGKASRWHSHGRGIPMSVLDKELNLKINDFGSEKHRNECVRDYYEMLVDYLGKIGAAGAIHGPTIFMPIRRGGHGQDQA